MAATFLFRQAIQNSSSFKQKKQLFAEALPKHFNSKALDPSTSTCTVVSEMVMLKTKSHVLANYKFQKKKKVVNDLKHIFYVNESVKFVDSNYY